MFMGSGGGGGGGGHSGAADALYTQQAKISREMWDQYRAHGVPQLHLISDRIQDMESPGGIARAEGAAASDVARSYDRQRTSLRNQLGRYGLSPSSGRFASGLRALALGEAADTAGAKTQARTGVLDRSLSGRFGLASAWQGNAGMAMQGLSNAAGGQASLADSQARARAAADQSSSSLWGSIGSAVGTLGGAWLLSDRRLKRDIARIGWLPTLPALPIYEFRYVDGDPTLYTGLMADDVLTALPMFVSQFNGYLMLNYIGILNHILDFQGRVE